VVVDRVEPRSLDVTAAGSGPALKSRLQTAGRLQAKLLTPCWDAFADDARASLVLESTKMTRRRGGCDERNWPAQVRGDHGLVSAAARVLDLEDAQGAASGKYNVTSPCGASVQIGSYKPRQCFRSAASRDDTAR